MKLITILGFITLLIGIFSCTDKKTDTSKDTRTNFHIDGQATGFADSTWLFLQSATNQIIDSALVIQGRFTMTGKVTDSIKTIQVILRTKEFSDYKFFWLENSDIKFNGEKGNLRAAIVSGSKTQADADAYDEVVRPIDTELDSLNRIGAEPNITQIKVTELSKLRAVLDEKRKNNSFTFIINHPNSIVSANILDVYASTWGKEKTKELYTLLTSEIKDSPYGKNVNTYLTLNKDLKIGDKFIDFEQVSYQGEKTKLSDFRGKIILLEFWAAWCGPCRQENPELVKTYKKFKDKGFEILGVSLDQSKEPWIQAIETDGLIWKNVSELNGTKNSAALIYGVSGIPDNFLIDQTGTIIDRNLRGDKLKDKLTELLK